MSLVNALWGAKFLLNVANMIVNPLRPTLSQHYTMTGISFMLISIRGREGRKLGGIFHHFILQFKLYPYLHNGGSVGIFRTFAKSDSYTHGRMPAEKIFHKLCVEVNQILFD